MQAGKQQATFNMMIIDDDDGFFIVYCILLSLFLAYFRPKKRPKGKGKEWQEDLR